MKSTSSSMCNITVRHNTRKILMIRSLLIGIVAGMRSLTPVAVISSDQLGCPAKGRLRQFQDATVCDSQQRSDLNGAHRRRRRRRLRSAGCMQQAARSLTTQPVGPRSHQVRTAERVGALPFLRGAHRSFQLSVR